MKTTIRCLRCGHEWVSMVDRPKVCPRCKSYVYDQPRKRGEDRNKEGVK